MLSPESLQSARAVRPRNLVRYFLIADFFYLLLVHAWGIGVGPLGRDFALLADPGTLGWPLRAAISAERWLFFDMAAPYHAVNLALLYGCMVAVFFLTRWIVGGPVWLGSLAAVIFMAHPAKSEATLHLTGAADLLPAFLGLSATTMYVRSARGARGGHGAAASRAYVSALAVFACAVLLFRGNLLLIAPLICHEFLLKKRDRRSPARLAPFTAIALAAFVAHGIASPPEVPAPLRLFAPLGLLFYPIGLLPETAGRFVAHPLLAYGAAALAIAALVFLERRVRLPAFTFALISMVLVRAGQDHGFIDPVHMTGGGALLLPLGFFAVGAAALCERIMRHPKWPKPMVLLTTALCVLLFLLQWGAIMSWRHAAREAARFRQQATAFATAHPNEVLGVLPDFQCFRGAPMMLSESIAYDTPFSRRVPHVSLLPMHYVGRKKAHITVAAWEPEEGVIRVDGARPIAVAPWPYTPEQTWPARAAVEVRLGEITDHGFDLRIRDRAGPLPRRLLPVINDATKPDSDDVAAAASPVR